MRVRVCVCVRFKIDMKVRYVKEIKYLIKVTVHKVDRFKIDMKLMMQIKPGSSEI